MSDSRYLTPNWPAPPNVHAASTLRSGGVSHPPYDSFNLASHVGDDTQCVAENRSTLRGSLDLPCEPAWLNQVHGTAVVEAGIWSEPPTADACVTRVTNRVCVVMTADCLPVLFSSDDGLHVGAAHAGWRGLSAGVLDRTVQAFGVPGERLMAWMGPAIGQAAFEVGDEVRAAFLADDAAAVDAFEVNARGRWQCDLYALARRRLQRLGVQQVSGGEYCTHREPEKFFSYRRDGQCGRMATLIWRT